jgi:hypothetical protein
MAAEPFDLKKWRTERLGVVKKTPEYKSLSPALRRLVDYLVRAHESPDQGITVRQDNEKLLAKFDVCRKTMNVWLCAIVGKVENGGVFTREKRWAGAGRGAGRKPNLYRLNPVILMREGYTEGYTEGYSESDLEGYRKTLRSLQAKAIEAEGSRSLTAAVDRAGSVVGVASRPLDSSSEPDSRTTVKDPLEGGAVLPKRATRRYRCPSCGALEDETTGLTNHEPDC